MEHHSRFHLAPVTEFVQPGAVYCDHTGCGMEEGLVVARAALCCPALALTLQLQVGLLKSVSAFYV